jgi:N,N'-diacetyllegionaminate synthase
MTLVVCEIGSCHDGSLEKAKHLIETAKVCGADVAKAQLFSAASHVERRHAPEYADVYRKGQIPPSWLPILKTECDRVGIAFGCSVSLAAHVPLVAPYVQYLKIPNFESQDRALRVRCLKTGIVTIISFGGGAYRRQGRLRDNERHLHCVAGYDVKLKELNLSVIRAQGFDGFSDHSGDIRVGGWAVQHGAEIIEAHLKLQTTDPKNPDAGKHALDPTSFKLYVDNIRDAELAFGDGIRRLQPSEQAFVKYRVSA